MKKWQLGFTAALGSCLFFVSVARAHNDVEQFKLNAWFGISKCMKKNGTDGQPKTDCQVVTPEQPVQASVALETCENLPDNGGRSCSGQWTDSRVIEGRTYVGTIRVTKTTDAAGKSSFVILSRTEEKDVADSITLHILVLAKSEVTDSSISFGKTVTQKDASGNDVSYVPILAVSAQSGLQGLELRPLARISHRSAVLHDGKIAQAILPSSVFVRWAWRSSSTRVIERFWPNLSFS